MTQMISIVRRYWLLLAMALFILLPSAPVSAKEHVPEFKMEPIAPITMGPSPWSSPVAPIGDWPYPMWWSGHPAMETYRQLAGSWVSSFIDMVASANPDFSNQYKSWELENNKIITQQLEALVKRFEKDSMVNPDVRERELTDEELTFLQTISDKLQQWERVKEQVQDATNAYVDTINQEADRQCSVKFCLAWDISPSVPVPAQLQILFTYRLNPAKAPIELKDEPLVAKIVAVKVSDDPYEEALNNAEAQMRDAAYQYNQARQNEANARKRFREALKEHSDVMSAQNRIVDTAQRKLRAAHRSSFVPNPRVSEIKKSANYRNIETSIAKEKETIARLQERIDQINSWGGDDQAKKDSMQTLANQIASAEKTIDSFQMDLEKLIHARRPQSGRGTESAEIIRLRRVTEDAQRAIRHANIALDVSSETLLENYEKLQATDQRYAGTLQKLEELKGKEGKPLLQIKTDYTFDARFTNRRAEMKDLNHAIKISRQAVREADYQREKARHTMLEADEETTVASEYLEQAIMDSASSQLALEAFMQAKEGIDASKAGPGVFLLWASNRVAQNLFNPPKVYEPEYRLDGEQSVSQQILESYYVKDEQEAAERLIKYGTSKTYDHLRSTASDTLKLGQIEKEMQKIVSKSRATSDTKSLADLLTRFKAQEKVYDEAAKSLSAKLYGAGKARLAASVSGNLLEAQLKSMGVEAIKRELADFFEGHAWRAYMRANQRFVLAVRVFRSSGNIYWENRDTLDGLLALRKEIKEKYYDEESNLQIEKSEEFDVKEELRFWLSFAGENGELSQQPHPGNVKVFLNNVPLKRKPNSDIFDLTESGAKALRQQGQKELTLKVVFQ